MSKHNSKCPHTFRRRDPIFFWEIIIILGISLFGLIYALQLGAETPWIWMWVLNIFWILMLMSFQGKVTRHIHLYEVLYQQYEAATRFNHLYQNQLARLVPSQSSYGDSPKAWNDNIVQTSVGNPASVVIKDNTISGGEIQVEEKDGDE